MAKDREEEPRIKIIDRRMLSEEERTGQVSSSSTSVSAPAPDAPSGIVTTSGGAAPQEERPKLEIIGGGRPAGAPEPAAPAQPEAAEEGNVYALDEEGEETLTEAEAEELRNQIEEEQFAVLEQQFGRPLTDAEKSQVRSMMDQQAQSMQRLEVAPHLLRSLTELPSFAVVHLGLRPNPYTGLIARNDAEARLAIDAFGALYDILKNKIDARASAELARVLNDLRANYTRITGAQITMPGGPRIIH